MSKHILNCFEVLNPGELLADYQLVDVDGPFDQGLADGELAESNLQQLTKQVAFSEEIPVAVVSGGESPVIAIPANHSLEKSEYLLSPDIATLSPRSDMHSLSLTDLTGTDAHIGLAFLGWHLRGALRRDRRLWNSDPWKNFFRHPLNHRHDNRSIDIFRGFALRLRVQSGRPYVWVKLTHKYIESDWVSDVYSESDIQQRLRMKHALYHYGHKWFPIQILGPCGKSISEQKFQPEGEQNSISIYDYTLREVGRGKAPAWIKSLDPDSPAIKYQYPGNQKKRYGAASLCKLMSAADDSRVGRLHRMSILPPSELMKETVRIVREYLGDIRFGDQPIRVSTSPKEARRKIFSVPPQEFGQGQTLRVGRDTAAGEVPFSNLGRLRMSMLMSSDGGVAVSSPLDAQYLLVPSTLDRTIVEDLKSRFERTARNLLHRGFRFELVVYGDHGSRKLKEQVESVIGALDKSKVTSGRGVVVLPERAEPDLHNFLKKRLRDRIQFQCLDANRVREFYGWKVSGKGREFKLQDSMSGRYQSYLRYAAMGLLIVNRQWPFILAEETHYDTYIGLDVLQSTAAFTFFSDGGRECFLHSIDSRQREKLLKEQVRTAVYEQMKDQLSTAERPPRSVVLRRDGKSFGSERRGFREAVERLIREGHLKDDTEFGVIEVHKSCAEGFRLVEEHRRGHYRNSTAGAWERIGDKEGIVCTTGFPFKFPGTANPLCVRVVEGPMKLQHVLEDTFAMSQLCWSAPDRCMRLSIDLKLCDDYLRSIAARTDDEEGLYGENEDDWGAGLEQQAVGWSA